MRWRLRVNPGRPMLRLPPMACKSRRHLPRPPHPTARPAPWLCCTTGGRRRSTELACPRAARLPGRSAGHGAAAPGPWAGGPGCFACGRPHPGAPAPRGATDGEWAAQVEWFCPAAVGCCWPNWRGFHGAAVGAHGFEGRACSAAGSPLRPAPPPQRRAAPSLQFLPPPPHASYVRRPPCCPACWLLWWRGWRRLTTRPWFRACCACWPSCCTVTSRSCSTAWQASGSGAWCPVAGLQTGLPPALWHLSLLGVFSRLVCRTRQHPP